KVYNNYKGDYLKLANGEAQLVKCSHFDTRLITLDDGSVTVDAGTAFYVVMCLEGSAMMRDNFGNEETLVRGETLLVPASVSTLTFSGTGKILTATM
ncbi:MAG: hypothetical protein ACI4BC_00610, partial [Muribaculaceae bacterium]